MTAATVDLDSERGRGTTVTVRFPAWTGAVAADVVNPA